MKQRNAARRFSRSAIASATSLADRAQSIVIPKYAWPPPSHPTLHRIRRTKWRILAAEIVRRTRSGDSYDEILLGAGRVAFNRTKWSDEVLREKIRALALNEPIYGVVRSLLDERR